MFEFIIIVLLVAIALGVWMLILTLFKMGNSLIAISKDRAQSEKDLGTDFHQHIHAVINYASMIQADVRWFRDLETGAKATGQGTEIVDHDPNDEYILREHVDGRIGDEEAHLPEKAKSFKKHEHDHGTTKAARPHCH